MMCLMTLPRARRPQLIEIPSLALSPVAPVLKEKIMIRECVGHSFAYVAHLVFLGDAWIRTQRAAVESRCATNLATHLPFLVAHLPNLAIHLLTENATIVGSALQESNRGRQAGLPLSHSPLRRNESNFSIR
jgi:hypothetical protein